MDYTYYDEVPDFAIKDIEREPKDGIVYQLSSQLGKTIYDDLSDEYVYLVVTVEFSSGFLFTNRVDSGIGLYSGEDKVSYGNAILTDNIQPLDINGFKQDKFTGTFDFKNDDRTFKKIFLVKKDDVKNTEISFAYGDWKYKYVDAGCWRFF